MTDRILSGKRILVVEDDYLVASELVAQLSARGVSVVGPALNVRKALEQLQSRQDLDGAILDINLGGEMVFPVADELARRGLPFIFATGYDANVVVARHADKILLRKPLDEEAVAAALLRETFTGEVTTQDASRNGILRRLSSSELDRLSPFLREIHLPRGAILEMAGQTVSRVYFPLDCVASMITVGRAGNRIETGLIGREGVTGIGMAEGDMTTPYELIIQIDGSALVMAAEDFKQALASVPNLRLLLARFARSLAVQVSYTALANGRFDILQRLARWLLMIHDRVHQNPFGLTHDYMAVMLGVRRPSVTETLHLLEGEHLIRSTRGYVEILDRNGLIKTAGEAYGSPEEEYARLMDLPLIDKFPN